MPGSWVGMNEGHFTLIIVLRSYVNLEKDGSNEYFNRFDPTKINVSSLLGIRSILAEQDYGTSAFASYQRWCWEGKCIGMVEINKGIFG